VTGATGQLGRQIVESLLTRVPAHRVGVSVRDPRKALTAAQALTFADIAGIASDVTGRVVTRTTAPDDRFREHLIGGGVPAETANQLLGVFTAARAGEFAAVDPTLATLLGREPIALATVLREQLLPRP
jgi:NAD(P)H dehydrogenase (quinone)